MLLKGIEDSIGLMGSLGLVNGVGFVNLVGNGDCFMVKDSCFLYCCYCVR